MEPIFECQSLSPVYLCEYFTPTDTWISPFHVARAGSRENGFLVALATLKEGLLKLAELIHARCFTRSTSRKLNENECVGG
jgi:hypothetical protein